MQAASPLIALLLGLIQGLTEFLPISSSGHLVLAQTLLDVRQPGIVIEVVLHAATLLAVIVALRREVARVVADAWLALRALPREGWGALRRARYAGWLLLGTVPAALAGLTLEGPIEAAFERPATAAACLLVTGLFLLATRWARERRPLGGRLSFGIGLAQAVSLLPGISRSGATVSAGLFLGAAPGEAVRFSFLLSIPAILGSVVLALPDLAAASEGQGLAFLGIGFVAAFLAGLAAIAWMLRLVARGKLHWFGVYCLLAGGAALWLLR